MKTHDTVYDLLIDFTMKLMQRVILGHNKSYNEWIKIYASENKVL